MNLQHIIELEIIKRGHDMNFFYASPPRGFDIYTLSRRADFYFDSIQLGDRITCLVEDVNYTVLSVERPEHQAVVEKLIGEK